MITRERKWILLTTCLLLLVVEVKLQSGREYDTNEWIPVTPSSLEASSSDTGKQKTASARVLSLDAPAQKFFPDEEYEYRNRRPNQVQQFLRESPVKKGAEHPRPRKIKHPSNYKFETPPPPPSKQQPQINYYNGQNLSPYTFEQPNPVRNPVTQHVQPNFYAPHQQVSNERPVANTYVEVPNVNPQVPEPNAPNLYEQYQLPFNSTFYQSLNPAILNNEFYQAIGNSSQNVQRTLPLSRPKSVLPVNNKPADVSKPTIEQERIQLVYVPVENLKSNKPGSQTSDNIYRQTDGPKQNTISFNTVPHANQDTSFKASDQPRQEKLVYNPPYLQQRPDLRYQQIDAPKQEKLISLQETSETKQHRLDNIQQDFIQKALQAHKLQQQLQDDINPLKQESISTTPKPSRKPHQPPLAVFLESQQKAEISDVLNILRDAKTISVQDTVTPNSPKIFVGPSNLDSPEGYTKFPLPYLNNINGNRIERKIDQLPFFVAPVSYKAPPGYSKISLPSPHVGSVVVSVPVTSTTTPEPLLFHQNQLNPFGISSLGYSPIDLPTPSRPTQNYLDNHESSERGRNSYQSTPATEVTESPLIPPVRNIFENQFETRQPDIYYTKPSPQQTYRETVPTLDIYRPQLQNGDRYPSLQENTRLPSSTVQPKEEFYENSQLPNVNPLELAINEFELHQINNQFDQPNKKVKHSTTRRPQTQSNYEDNQTVSSSRAPISRGRQTYELEPTTERTTTRGRAKGRGRGTSSRIRTTTTTTTPIPTENDRYTILEEFAAREPSRSLSTENYGRFSAEAKTETPRISSTPVNSNAYLPEPNFENSRPESDFVSSRSQTQFEENFKNRRPQSGFGNNNPPTEHSGEYQNTKSETAFSNRRPQTDDTQFQQQFDQRLSQTDKIEPSKTQPLSSLDVKEPQTVHQPSQNYQENTEIENIPASVYSLGKPQTYDTTAFDFDSSRNSQEPTKLYYENVQLNSNARDNIINSARPSSQDAKQAHRFSPDIVSYENREPNQQIRPQERPTYQQYDNSNDNEPVLTEVYQSENYQRPLAILSDNEPEKQKPKQQSVTDPSGFLENLYQPNFDQTYLSLQDQAVRSLLVPNLLVPSTKPQLPLTSSTKEIISSTETIVNLSSSTEAETTTTTRAPRTRGRGRARPATTSATSAPRRTAGRRRPVSRTSTESTASIAEYSSREEAERRRPVSRTSTENIVPITEYSSVEDTERSGTNTKQNFRTRSRPVQNTLSDRISTTENDVGAFKEPTLEGGFEGLNNREPPQSYMQFEHAIDEQQIITINPNINQDTEGREYQQVYNLPSQSTTERQQLTLEYENTKLRSNPVVDVQVSHVLPEENQQKPDVITKPIEGEQYVRYNNANIKSGGIINNNKPVTTTKEPSTKTRGRTRGRSRFATTPKTTARPVARISTSSPLRTTTEEEQEFYGFIRQPAQSQKNIQAQAPVQTSSRNDEPAIKFVGEIRPKYNARKTTYQSTEEVETAETPRPRVRARTRAPTRKTTNIYRQSNNDVNHSKNTEPVTRRSGTTTRGRTRGSSHYRAPENQKRESEDEDVANQNYPVNFLQKLDASSPKPTNAAFQITLDPLDQDSDDQSPYSSIYRPKFVPKPDGWVNTNGLPVEDKPFSKKPEEITTAKETELTFSTEEPQSLPFVQTTQNSGEIFTQFADSEVTNIMLNIEKIKTEPTEQTLTTLEPTEESTHKKKNRRKGAWKLVRQRPVDSLEVSESQNYESVLNLFESIQKVDPYTKSDLMKGKFNTNTESYDNESFNSEKFKDETNHFGADDYHNQYFKNKNTKNKYVENQDFADQSDIEEIVTEVTENEAINTEQITETQADELLTTTPSTFKTQENIFDTIYEMFGIFNKPEVNKNKTVLSEESENDPPTTTIVTPVFPEEITEELSTSSTSSSTQKIIENPENDNESGKINRDEMETTEKILTTTSEVKPSTKPYEVEPWEMRAVKTSTSTEVSHETEICYKGRCVKSKEKKKYK